ncbi:hypothetical protein VPH35_080414 [Triticum aestivum]
MASPRGAPGSPEGIPGMSPCSIVFGARGGSMKEIEALDRCSQVQSQQRPHTSPRCWLVWIQRQGVGEDRGDTGEDPHPILFTCHKFLMDDGTRDDKWVKDGLDAERRLDYLAQTTEGNMP